MAARLVAVQLGVSFLLALLFLAQGLRPALAALAGGATDPALDQEIVTGWYSGVQQAASGEEVVTYTDALVWKALDYTKPQAWCGGETGYWALPPGEG